MVLQAVQVKGSRRRRKNTSSAAPSLLSGLLLKLVSSPVLPMAPCLALHGGKTFTEE